MASLQQATQSGWCVKVTFCSLADKLAVATMPFLKCHPSKHVLALSCLVAMQTRTRTVLRMLSRSWGLAR